MRALALAVALLAYAAPAAWAGTMPGPPTGSVLSDPCVQSEMDYGTPWFINRPDESCIGRGGASSVVELKRWTPSRVVEHEGAAITIGAPEFATLDTGAPIPDISSSCFGLSVSGGDQGGENLALYADALIDEASERGLARPLLFRSYRFEELVASQIGTNDATAGVTSPSAEWFLLTDRSATAWKLWHTGDASVVGANTCPADAPGGTGGPCCYSHCRVPNDATVDCAYDYDAPAGADGDGGCDDPGDEGAYTLATYLRNKTVSGFPTMEEFGVYSVFYRSSTQYRGPSALLMDVTHDDYVEWVVDYFYEEQKRITQLVTGSTAAPQAYIGPEVVMKDQFYTTTGESNVQHWPDIGDGLGGESNSSTLTLVDRNHDELWTGPPEIRNTANYCDSADTTWSASAGGATFSGCRFTWPYYIFGMYKIVKALHDHTPRIPALITLNPTHFDGCGASYRNGSPSFDNGSCTDNYDDSSTVTSNCTALGTPHPACTAANTCVLDCNEAAMFRAIYQYAGYVRMDIKGGDVDSNMGCCGGIGLSYNQLAAVVEGGSPAPIWVKPVDTAVTQSFAVPPKLCRDRREANPPTVITP